MAVPTLTLLGSMAADLATNATALGSSSACHLHLIVEPFVPSNTTDFTTLTEASFTGYGELSAGTGAQQVFNQPESALKVVQMKEPAGGWHFEASGDTDPPQTVYGWCLTDNSDTFTFGSGLLDTPVVIAVTDDAVDIPNVRFSFTAPVLS